MEFQDYYKTLGLTRGATEAEIKSTYRKLARKYHPDVNPGNKEAERRFKEINEAYQVLGDPEKRKKYDELGADWQRGASEDELRRRYARAGMGHGWARAQGDFSDFFANFFGGGLGRGFARGAGNPASERAPDLEAEVEISLEEAIHGATRRLELSASDECPVCQGSGMVMESQRAGQARVVRAARECPNWAGTGDGNRMRLAGQGGRGVRANLNGDLYLTVRIQPHRIFKLEGRDLRSELPVWDYEAVLGAEVTVPTAQGKISLKVPPASQTGRVMRLRGKGLPARGREPAGDLLFELKVMAPLDLTEPERALMRELARHRSERHAPDPRADLLR